MMVSAKVIKERLKDRACGMCHRNDGLHPLECYQEWLNLSLKLYRQALNVAARELRLAKDKRMLDLVSIGETLDSIREMVNLQGNITSED